MNKKNQEYFYLQPKEELAMKVSWDTEDALSASEIAERIPNRDWPATSIQSILRNLEKKNAIWVDAITKLGKAYGRLFRPTLSANEYAAMQFERYYQNGRTDYTSMISALLGNTSANNDDILKTLQELIKTYDKKKGG